MPLAEYLASEQARDRLKTADVLTMPSASEWHGHGQKVVIEQCDAWWRVSVTVANETVSAYYRPDGDRYVVTDLGEGARAACLRGLDLANAEHFERLNALGRTLDDDFRQTAPLGWIELRDITAADLPDAICRVMRPWRDRYDEMARKTAVRRLAKYLPLSPELANAMDLDDRDSELQVAPIEVDEPLADKLSKRAAATRKPETVTMQSADPPTPPESDGARFYRLLTAAQDVAALERIMDDARATLKGADLHSAEQYAVDRRAALGA